MTDTEARRLAEEIGAGELMSSSELLQHYSYEQLAMVTWRSGMEKQKIARACLNLLTRLETPGLTTGEQRAVDNLRTCQTQLDMDGCMVGVSRQAVEETLAAIDRLTTQPEAAGGLDDEGVQRVGLEYFSYIKAMRLCLHQLGMDEKMAEALIARLTKNGFVWEKV